MKKSILILFAVLFILSCSTSDDSETSKPTNEDYFIGKWTTGKTSFVNSTVTTDISPTACDLQTSYNFINDNTFILISILDDGNGGCESEPINSEYYKWKKNSENSYSLITKEPNESEHINILKVIFVDNNTMKWIDEGQFSNYYDPNDNNEYSSRESWFNRD